MDEERKRDIEAALVRHWGPDESAGEAMKRVLEASIGEALGRVLEAASMKTGKATMSFSHGIPVVRVRMRGKTAKRSVTAGLDAFTQLMEWALEAAPGARGPEILPELEALLGPEAGRIRREVGASVDSFMKNPEAVRAGREKVVAWKAKERRREGENLVSGMVQLLSSGWTREDLLASVDEAVLRSVMVT